MKSYIEKNEISYPCLREHTRYDGLIVLFSSPTAGTVVHNGDTEYAIGYHTNMWDSNQNQWKLFTGKIVLEGQ